MDIRTRRKIYPGGFADNLALSAISASAFTAHPALGLGMAGGLVGAGLAAAGGAWAARRVVQAGYRSVFSMSSVKINSDSVPDAPKGGITLGYTVDTGEPLVIPWEDWMRHCLVVGQSGVGKTVFGEWTMFQQITNGGGLLWIDGKLDPDNLYKLDAMCAYAGRRADLLVINAGDPRLSNSYNPILYGDPDEVSSRIISLIPSAENNPGADYYRQAANQGVTTLVGAIQRAGMGYNFMDLTILLQNQRALNALENMVPARSSEAKALKLFLDQYKQTNKDGIVSIDMKRLKDTFGGIGGRMHMFGSGNFGEITNTYSPDINLYEAIRQNKIIYVMLPTMGKKEAASNFGKMLLGDFRSAIAKIQELPLEERPNPPFLNFSDEFGSYVTQAADRPFEQGRSAGIVMMPAFQTMANLDAVSEELREMVLGNTWNKVFFKVGTNDTAEKIVELIGKERRVALTLSMSGGQSAKQDTFGTTGDTSGSDSFGLIERTEEVEKVTADMLKDLGKGEAIVTYGGSKVYHIRIPALRFEQSFLEEIGPFSINKRRPYFTRGLDFFRNVDGLLSNN